MDYLDHPHHRYGTTSLDQRSRSPSPMTARMRAPHPAHFYHHQPPQHSYPVLNTRRIGPVRRLPPTPNKPSSLLLKAPANINFPKLNASPTHGSLAAAAAVQAAGSLLGPAAVQANGLATQALAVGPAPCPLSFGAQATCLYSRRSDSDEDWC